ncbi:MAG: biotin--[acetyl-CoA-carboxylase] ligase [Ginsengibacter sp.]
MTNDTESLIILDSVDSTNNYAMGVVHSGVSDRPLAVMALVQTAGKGRHTKQWKSEKGKNLTASFIVDLCPIAIYRQFELIVDISLACAELFKNRGATDVQIKWPNDIYYNDKKAGGILIENVLRGNLIKTSVIGIGININQTDFPEGINATSLALITGKEFDVKEICLELNEMIRKRLELINTIPFKKRLADYNSTLYGRGEVRRLKKGNQVFETTILRVDDSGLLVTSDVMERTFQLDEIQWIL